MPCKRPHGIAKGVGLPSPAIIGGSKVSQESDLVFLMCSQASKMLPDAAKGTQDAIRIVANPSEMFTDAPKMVSVSNVRSLFIRGVVWGGLCRYSFSDLVICVCLVDM